MNQKESSKLIYSLSIIIILPIIISIMNIFLIYKGLILIPILTLIILLFFSILILMNILFLIRNRNIIMVINNKELLQLAKKKGYIITKQYWIYYPTYQIITYRINKDNSNYFYLLFGINNNIIKINYGDDHKIFIKDFIKSLNLKTQP